MNEFQVPIANDVFYLVSDHLVVGHQVPPLSSSDEEALALAPSHVDPLRTQVEGAREVVDSECTLRHFLQGQIGDDATGQMLLRHHVGEFHGEFPFLGHAVVFESDHEDALGEEDHLIDFFVLVLHNRLRLLEPGLQILEKIKHEVDVDVVLPAEEFVSKTRPEVFIDE